MTETVCITALSCARYA